MQACQTLCPFCKAAKIKKERLLRRPRHDGNKDTPMHRLPEKRDACFGESTTHSHKQKKPLLDEEAFNWLRGQDVVFLSKY